MNYVKNKFGIVLFFVVNGMFMTSFCVILAEKHLSVLEKHKKILLAYHLKLYKQPDKRRCLVNLDFLVKLNRILTNKK